MLNSRKSFVSSRRTVKSNKKGLLHKINVQQPLFRIFKIDGIVYESIGYPPISFCPDKKKPVEPKEKTAARRCIA